MPNVPRDRYQKALKRACIAVGKIRKSTGCPVRRQLWTTTMLRWRLPGIELPNNDYGFAHTRSGFNSLVADSGRQFLKQTVVSDALFPQILSQATERFLHFQIVEGAQVRNRQAGD